MITRLITSTVLSLLLLFALAASAHSDFDGSPAVTALPGATPSLAVESPVTESPVTAPNGVEPNGAESPDAAVAAHHRERMIASPSVASAFFGAAICVIGVLCGLAAIILLLRTLLPPRFSSLLRARPHFLPASPVRPAPPRATALSLTLLGLSRT